MNDDTLQQYFIEEDKPKIKGATTSNSLFYGLISLLLVIIGILGITVVMMYVSHKKQAKPHSNPPLVLIKPKRLQAGQTIGLFSPASNLHGSVSNVTEYAQRITGEMKDLFSLNAVFSDNALGRYIYLSGNDTTRASDISQLVRDSNVHGMMANRGGWGCNRILSLIDYELIKKHPKVMIGHSDLTGCLLAIFFTTGLVTLHGPMGVNPFIENWSGVDYNLNTYYLKKIAFDNEMVEFRNTPSNPITTIHGGKGKGRLIGGNLAVLSAMVGSDYIPPKSKFNLKWEETILFLEEVHEGIAAMDRFMTQLKTAGILHKLAGFVFGTCFDCSGTNLFNTMLEAHIPSTVPTFTGSQIGHDGQQFTIPIGILAEIDANRGTIRMLEKALSD